MKRAPQPVLEVEKLSLRRGATKIIRTVSWRVLPGEHWVILGANGSGKTSLLSALTGYVTPSSGEIFLLGERFGASDWRELRKLVGLVSSSVRQMMAEDESALDIVASGKDAVIDCWREPSRASRQRALRLLRRVGCARVAARPWCVLSQGERQRVLIARALMAQQDVLILDEPCAGLDPAARENFLSFIQTLASRKNSPTIIFVTHHVEEITPAFSHVLMLKAGRVIAAGNRKSMMTSATLSGAFSMPMRLRSKSGRYELRVARLR
jgi:iron complex transport system ATP-binding protein